MRYCVRCVYPANHPLNLTFDDVGVCSGCRVHEEKDELDWEVRGDMLRQILREYRSISRHVHDCIIPVSGARDSYFVVHTVKNVFGMHPLLVSYNKQYNTRLGIRNLAYLRSLMGCDFVQQTISPERVKRITRETLRLRGSMYWHCLAGQTVFPVQQAVRLRIPLIVWGAHQGMDQVGMFSHLDEVEMTRKYRKDHDLMGLEAEDLAAQSQELDDADVEPFAYPHDADLAAVGVRGIYLNNYVRWDSKAQHEQMIDCYGYETMRQQRTFDTYNDVDCWHYSGVHDYIKYLKWGYGKVSDHASREIRLKRMTREQGIGLVQRFQEHSRPRDTPMFLDWIGMQEDEFWETVNEHRDPSAWQQDEEGRWRLQDSITRHREDAGVEDVRLGTESDCHFKLTEPREPHSVDDRYVLIGRGWVDACKQESHECAAS